ncbi:MAG TPA: antibiotic biosynthesis monooxygenase [Anaerolineales bacterium]|nr:antibiotic biosynthesis monooxygenase [Anaerolineales bacterium]
MINVVWEYRVKEDQIAEFIRIYSSKGIWAELFKKGTGFVETKLTRSPDHPNLFVTIDQWESQKEYDAFLLQYKTEYEKLDKQCDGLTEHESYIGTFQVDINDKE